MEVRKLLIALSAATLTTVVHGQATVEPATEPFMTLAPYVLKSTNLEPRIGNEDGGTRAYRPWFESGSWTGDLIEYEVTVDGVRLVRGDIGQYPRDGADWRGTQALWSARYSFPDYEAYDQAQELDPAWECTEENANYWKQRNIFTVSAGTRVSFLWNQLSAVQRQTLDAVTAANSLLESEPYASPILNFVRGDRSNERCKQDGNYRWRFSVLGAIVNSMPVYVPAGTDGLVVVGANDGMLHGFSASDGAEVFAYVPSMLLGKVGVLRISPYQPTHFVDGELRHRDIGTTANPQHIVAGGLGAGGKGLFVLDVTLPANPSVIRELSGTNAGFVGGLYDSRIGHVRGRPTIARVADGTPGGRWHAIAGNGYGSDTGTAQLVLIPVDGGAPEFIATDATANNGLSAPSLVDATGNGIVDYAYAGDLQGNLWRFDMNAKTATKLFAAGASKPITIEPDIGIHPDTQQGFMVYFGTGSLLSGADAQNTSTQTIYGIWDRGIGETVAESRLITQTLVADTVTWPVPQDDQNFCASVDIADSATTVRFVADQQAPVWTGADANLGWRVHLPRAGERLIGRAQIRAGRVQFVTTNPYDMSDPNRAIAEGAGSWILQLDLATGGNAKMPVSLFDLNKNCMLDDGDGAPQALTIGGTTVAAGTYPIGVNLGAFHIAQPSFARVRFNHVLQSVVDGVYINALQLPLIDPPVEPSHGPIDVMTDSPQGPAHPGPASEPWREPWKEPFGTEQFPEASGPTKPFVRHDGLGHRVDGHSANYNYHHGVNYVDLFDLEPRRDQFRLDIGSVYRESSTSYPRLITEQPISRRELNRVTEVGVPDSQRFIVVVANADLSRENEIQIGCRTWSVYEYQTIMMRALRKNPVDMMADLTSQGLVFTLDDIRPGGVPAACGGGRVSTLRITPTERVGTLDATVATLPGCVNNTDHYAGSPPNAHLTRKTQLNADGTFKTPTTTNHPLSLYANQAHVTPNREGSGYRWRNGALTVQLLAVNADGTPGFVLQPELQLPRGSGIEGEDRGWGGAYALGFTLSGSTVVPINDGSSPPLASALTNGMLFELSMFWHWGDMTRFQQQGVGSPVTAFCYGASGNVAPSLMYETDWFTPGAYQSLTEGFTEALQQEYLRLLQDLQSNNPEIVEAALIALAEMFEANPDIAVYHRLRHYVPNSRQLQEHHLIGLDSGGLGSEADDGTPAQVIDIERDLLPSLGPNYRPGRRSWIDLEPTP
jgi:hypothetical protein